jgi:hypothetical protein
MDWNEAIVLQKIKQFVQEPIRAITNKLDKILYIINV